MIWSKCYTTNFLQLPYSHTFFDLLFNIIRTDTLIIGKIKGIEKKE